MGKKTYVMIGSKLDYKLLYYLNLYYVLIPILLDNYMYTLRPAHCLLIV